MKKLGYGSTMTLQSIAITTPASKLIYKVGESLDISGFDSSIPASSQTLTITVGGKTAAYIITVKAISNNNKDDSGRHSGSNPAVIVPSESPVIEVTFAENTATATETVEAAVDSNWKATIAVIKAEVSGRGEDHRWQRRKALS